MQCTTILSFVLWLFGLFRGYENTDKSIPQTCRTYTILAIHIFDKIAKMELCAETKGEAKANADITTKCIL